MAILIDIGSGNGDYAISMANKFEHVYAVEQGDITLLSTNVKVSGNNNITIINSPIKSFMYGMNYTTDISLGQLLDMTGGCDYLHCNIGGDEWILDYDALLRIPIIEMDLHNTVQEKMHTCILKLLIDNYDITIRRSKSPNVICTLFAYRTS